MVDDDIVDVNLLANVDNQRLWNKDEFWENNADESWSLKFKTTQRLWDEFLSTRISEYAKGDILEIAPGHGRITKYLIPLAKTLTLVDLNENCINICMRMFSQSKNIKYFVNNGYTLDCVDDDCLDFVFSWDSFVHMHRTVIESYLKEISKKLRKGGCGYIHHAHFKMGQEISTNNVAGRANMSPSLFAEMCKSYGLEVINQEYYEDKAVTDCITTFKKS